MRYEQDYIIRLIKDIAKMIYSIFLEANKNELENDSLCEEYFSLIDSGEINLAENILFDKIENKEKVPLNVVVRFYEYLNEKTDEFLISSNYSREEILEGLLNSSKLLGIEGLDFLFMKEI